MIYNASVLMQGALTVDLRLRGCIYYNEVSSLLMDNEKQWCLFLCLLVCSHLFISLLLLGGCLLVRCYPCHRYH